MDVMRNPHQAFFDDLAAEWDLNYTAEDMERLSHLMDTLGVEPGMCVLDLGCATGILFDLLRRKVGDKGLVTGVDFSIAMAERAHRNFPFNNVTVVDADACCLPFQDATYDMAVSFAAFPHFHKKEQALSEVDRVLKAGAKYFIIHLASSKELADRHHEEGGVLANDELPSETDLRRMFADSHFEDVQIEDHPGLFLASAVNAK